MQLLIIALTVCLAACGQADRSAEPSEPTRAGLLVSEPSAQTVTVTIAGMAYNPSVIEVAAGTTVVFRNADDVVHTATAVEVMLRMAEHLSDAIPHGGRHAVADTDQFARLLTGVNLLLAYLAQLSGRLAHQVDTATGADLSALPAQHRAELTKAVAAASCRLEESAGLVKEAHLATASVVRR